MGAPMLGIKVKDVPDYLKTKGIVRTRATVYNWIETGVKGHKLRVYTRGGQLFTMRRWVDEFVALLDQR